jgi:hypothetical protein
MLTDLFGMTGIIAYGNLSHEVAMLDWKGDLLNSRS